jgi:hypothetical protein
MVPLQYRHNPNETIPALSGMSLGATCDIIYGEYMERWETDWKSSVPDQCSFLAASIG